MNLPNKLTMLRIVMIPFFVVFLLVPPLRAHGDLIAFCIFVAASLTDMLDGQIARRYNMITNFGKFMDPLADKLLVCSAMICLVSMERLSAWILIVIISREFIISGFRLIAAERKIVIAANIYGKIKTVLQMFMVMFLILHFENTAWQILSEMLVWASLVMTVVSLVVYIWQNRAVLSEEDDVEAEEAT